MSMIPKVIHFNYFWDAIPEWLEINIAEFRAMNPQYEVTLWSSLPDGLPTEIQQALDWAPTKRFKSDLVRMWILQQFGGIYLDADTRPINAFSDELLGVEVFAASYGGRIADNYFMGSVAGHELWAQGIKRGLDRDAWAEPERYFGTVNTITGPRPDYAFAHRQLAASEVRNIQNPIEWQELVARPRQPLPDGPEYIKHYQLHGQVQRITKLNSWVVRPGQLTEE